MKLLPIKKSICDFLLIFHCNYLPTFCHFRDITFYWSKICLCSPFSPTPVAFEILTKGVPLKRWRERWSPSFLPFFIPSFLPFFLGFFLSSFLPSLLACLLPSFLLWGGTRSLRMPALRPASDSLVQCAIPGTGLV